MLRSLAAGFIAAIVAATFMWVLLGHRDSPPPNNVTVNYVPYPQPVTTPAAPKASVPAPTPKPCGLGGCGGPIQSVKKPGKTWSRVVIIDGRKCYQPMGGGPITARYCE